MHRLFLPYFCPILVDTVLEQNIVPVETFAWGVWQAPQAANWQANPIAQLEVIGMSNDKIQGTTHFSEMFQNLEKGKLLKLCYQ